MMINAEFSLPVAIPLRFFRTAPWWLVAAVLVFVVNADQVLASRYHPLAFALAHMLMLGFCGNIMLGALMQVSAVLAGVRARRAVLLGMAVWVALQLGTALLAIGLWRMHPALLQGAALLLGGTLSVFSAWLILRLWRSEAVDASSAGLGWATLGLLVTVLLGLALVMVLTRGLQLPLPHLLRLHVLFGGMGWVFALLASVAITVVPMFLVTPPWSQRLSRLLLPGNALLLLILMVLPGAQPLVLVPVLLFVFQLLRSLRQSRRTGDPARWLWAWGGVNLLAVCALLPSVGTASGLVAVLLAGQFVCGVLLPIFTAMLGKIVPFLLWLDYRRQVVSGRKLRHMGQLYPERWLRFLGALALTISVAWPLASFTRWPIALAVTAWALGQALTMHLACRRTREACAA